MQPNLTLNAKMKHISNITVPSLKVIFMMKTETPFQRQFAIFEYLVTILR